jgi:hypothetical protein
VPTGHETSASCIESFIVGGQVKTTGNSRATSSPH